MFPVWRDSLIKKTLVSFRNNCHVFNAFRSSALQSFNVNKDSFWFGHIRKRLFMEFTILQF